MKKILIVVDMQKDFIDGSLVTQEARDIVEKVRQKILSYPKENVYATLDTHTDDYLSSQEGQNLPVPHCIKGTEGWELDASLQGLIPPDHFFEKGSFGSLDLAKILQKQYAEQETEKDGLSIELIGLCTDICVVSNALLLKAFLPEVPLSVDSSCCAGVTKEKHEAALETLRSCQVKVY
ncbi:MAG: cysteine hydrolase [Lachnospiraceae bacterium]|nr:cysteine hydrolase [Lachnospiraceae bacterium]